MLKYKDNEIKSLYGNAQVKKICYLGNTIYWELDNSKIVPAFDVVNNIASYTMTSYQYVYDKATSSWYTLNNNNTYEKYGVYESVDSLETATKYIGKLVTYDGKEYKWTGSEWDDCGTFTLVIPENEYEWEQASLDISHTRPITQVKLSPSNLSNGFEYVNIFMSSTSGCDTGIVKEWLGENYTDKGVTDEQFKNRIALKYGGTFWFNSGSASGISGSNVVKNYNRTMYVSGFSAQDEATYNKISQYMNCVWFYIKQEKIEEYPVTYTSKPVPSVSVTFDTEDEMNAYTDVYVGLMATVGSKVYKYTDDFEWEEFERWMKLDLNSQWCPSTETNPDSTKYSIFESFSNYNVSNSVATCKLTFFGYDTFTLKGRSYGETYYDYLFIGKIDDENASYSNNQYSFYGKSSPSTWYDVTITSSDRLEHFVKIGYRKNGGGNLCSDKAYIAIPYFWEQTTKSTLVPNAYYREGNNNYWSAMANSVSLDGGVTWSATTNSYTKGEDKLESIKDEAFFAKIASVPVNDLYTNLNVSALINSLDETNIYKKKSISVILPNGTRVLTGDIYVSDEKVTNDWGFGFGSQDPSKFMLDSTDNKIYYKVFVEIKGQFYMNFKTYPVYNLGSRTTTGYYKKGDYLCDNYNITLDAGFISWLKQCKNYTVTSIDSTHISKYQALIFFYPKDFNSHIAQSGAVKADWSEFTNLTHLWMGSGTGTDTLKEVILPPNLQVVYQYGLIGMPGVKHLTFPSTFRYFGHSAIHSTDWEYLEFLGTTPPSYSSSYNTIGTNNDRHIFNESDEQTMRDKGFKIVVPDGYVDTYKSSSFFSPYAEFIVSHSEYFNVSSITLSETSLSFTEEGATQQLTATIAPTTASNQTLTWSSSDETVATVDSTGLVTAVANGDVTITASATDGSNVSATCSVNVNIPTVEDDGSQPNNEVWYTTTDDSALGLTATTSYGEPFGSSSTIVSNTYADGKGIIKASSDITVLSWMGNTSDNGKFITNNDKLKTISFPASLTNVIAIIDGCSNLESITFNSVDVPSWATNWSEIVNCSKLTAIYVPSESVDAYKAATGWSTYASKIQALG